MSIDIIFLVESVSYFLIYLKSAGEQMNDEAVDIMGKHRCFLQMIGHKNQGFQARKNWFENLVFYIFYQTKCQNKYAQKGGDISQHLPVKQHS